MSDFNNKENETKVSLSDEAEKRRRAMKKRAQKRRAARNRKILFIVILLIVVALVVGVVSFMKNNAGPRAEETVLSLKSDGSIVFEEVTELGGEYDASAFKSYAKNEVKSYEPAEGESVEFKRAGVKDGIAYVCVEYSSAAAYSDFTGYEAFYGTVKEANSAGYDVESNVSAKEGDLTGDEKVLILKEIVKVALPDDVLYTSENWVEPIEGGVNILPINGNIDAPPLAYIVMGQKASGDKTEAESEE